MSKKTLSLVVFEVKSACNNMATKLEMRLSGHQHMLERRRFVLELMNTSYKVTRRTKAISKGAAMHMSRLSRFVAYNSVLSKIVAYVYNLGVVSHGGKMKQACCDKHHHDV